jgi:invasion protein IalB
MRSAGLLVAAVLLASPARAAEAAPLLASAPVDATVFRDGEVRRTAEPFGRWTLVCDGIPRLGHKFCSLRSDTVELGGAPVSLLVSTGDDGRPAALLRLPFGLSLPYGLQVTPLGPSRAIPRRVPVAVCSAGGCEAVWTLGPDEIAALRSGAGLRVAVRGWRFDGPAPAPVAAIVAGNGFAGAVAASLR